MPSGDGRLGGGGPTPHRGARAFRGRAPPGDFHVAAPQSQDQWFPLRIREEEFVGARRLRVEIDPRAPRESHSLNVRSADLSDQEDERATGAWVVELDINLARRRLEPHLDPYRRDRVEDEILRQVGKCGDHAGATPSGIKSCGFDRSVPARLNRSPNISAPWQ